MFQYMKLLNRFLFPIILIIGLGSTGFTEEEKLQIPNTELNLYSGMFDFSDQKQRAVLVGFQHQNEELYRDTFLGTLSPITGGFVTENSALYVYSGIEWNFDVGPLKLTPSFAPGLYGAGDVKIDTSGKYKTLSKDSKKWKFEILSGKYKGVWTLTKWKDDKWLIIRTKTLGSENWGGDPEGPLAKALAKARKSSKKSKPPLKIEKLSAESDKMFRREATLFGIGVVSAVIGTFLAEMLIDRYREDPELLDTPMPKENA